MNFLFFNGLDVYKRQQITFYHWGYQCPIIAEMLELFQEAAMDDVTCIDITGQEKLAFEKQLYYPFLTIFNQQLHWYGPVTAAVLKGVRDGAITREKPYVIEQSYEEKRGELLPLTSETPVSYTHLAPYYKNRNSKEWRKRKRSYG